METRHTTRRRTVGQESATEQNLAICKSDLEGVSLGDISQTQKDKLSYSHEKSKNRTKPSSQTQRTRWMVEEEG